MDGGVGARCCWLYPHRGLLEWPPGLRPGPLRTWVAEAGARCPLPKCQVEELEGFVLSAKASHGTFQKEGGIGLGGGRRSERKHCLFWAKGPR